MASARLLAGVAVISVLSVAARSAKTNQYRDYSLGDLCLTNKSTLFIVDGSGSYSAIRMHGSGVSLDKSCSVIIRPPSYYGIILTLTSMSFGNYSHQPRGCFGDYIEISGESHSVKLCGSLDKGEAKHFTSWGEMRLSLHAASLERNGSSELALVATAYRKEYIFIPCTKKEFRCNKSVCVWNGLACDGVNNCGDFSDEREDCEKIPTSTEVDIWILQPTIFPNFAQPNFQASVIILILFVLLLLMYRYCCCRTDLPHIKYLVIMGNQLYKASLLYYDDDDSLLDLKCSPTSKEQEKELHESVTKS